MLLEKLYKLTMAQDRIALRLKLFVIIIKLNADLLQKRGIKRLFRHHSQRQDRRRRSDGQNLS